MDYSVIPWTTFTDPEIARVGLSENEARARNISVEVTRFNLDDLDRAIADEAAHGFVKVLTPVRTASWGRSLPENMPAIYWLNLYWRCSMAWV